MSSSLCNAPGNITASGNGISQQLFKRIVLVQSKALPEFSQKSLADIAGVMDVEPLDAVDELLLAEIDDMNGLMVVGYAYREDDIRPVFLHDRCMVGSDATALAPDGFQHLSNCLDLFFTVAIHANTFRGDGELRIPALGTLLPQEGRAREEPIPLWRAVAPLEECWMEVVWR